MRSENEARDLKQKVKQLQSELLQAEIKASQSNEQKNKLLAKYQMLESQAEILNEQLLAQQETGLAFQTKYEKVREEFTKMKDKYESELGKCVSEMESLRVIVTDVISSNQASEKKLTSAT